jgi:transmembrane sensor
MENNNQYDEVLVRYLNNEETNEEKVFVENWLNASEDNKRYFNRLKKAWQLTDIKQDLAYITNEANLEAKWNHLEKNITQEKASIISINEQEIIEDEKPARKPVVYRLLLSSAIAASILLVVGLGWKLFVDNKMETPVVKNTVEKTESVVFADHREVNTTGKEKRIQLPDGSMILLADKSEITYRAPFTNSRDITLKGKAYFKVAKDNTRPFTVYSGIISTTALGTEFTVTAFENTNRIIVRLYEGKVVVKPAGKKSGKLKKDVYLLPGQAFVYTDGLTKKPKTFKIDEEKSPEKILIQEMEQDNPSLPQNARDAWYMFNNQSLEQVLDELSGIYNVKIIFNKEEVQNIYFTRRYNRSDSLEFILQEIGTLNNLKITKKDNAFVITK